MIAALLTLAMAIGANAVVFGILNGPILKPLQVPEAESLYSIECAADKDTSQSYPHYLRLQSGDPAQVLSAFLHSQYNQQGTTRCEQSRACSRRRDDLRILQRSSILPAPESFSLAGCARDSAEKLVDGCGRLPLARRPALVSSLITRECLVRMICIHSHRR